MKNSFVLSIFIVSLMIFSCQRQDFGAEAQLEQRKTELDAREEALIQREKAVAERERAVDKGRIVQSQRQVPDAAQAEAERQRRIQQLPPELRALVPNRSRIESEGARKMQDRAVQTPPDVNMSRAPAASDTKSPEVETISPAPSPTP